MKQHNRFFVKPHAILAGLLICSTVGGQQALADSVQILTGPPPQAEETKMLLSARHPISLPPGDVTISF